jgi:UDP-2,4-diacetamido-2,4,6-trideoxy-beta-L-altropyranose hydrolase
VAAAQLKRPVVIFRCDASPQLGAGHVTRCVALAETFAGFGWRCVFCVGADTTAVFPRLASNEYEVNLTDGDDAAAVAGAVRGAASEATIVVVDHYGLDRRFEEQCRSFAGRIVAFEDQDRRVHDCDVLIDAAAVLAAAHASQAPSAARVLNGPAFAVVRSGFLKMRAASLQLRAGGSVENIVVSVGATDPNNITATILDAVRTTGWQTRVTVPIAGKAPHVRTLAARRDVDLVPDPADMAALLATADIAVGAAGVSAYERAVLGIPSVVLHVAENQRGISSLLTNAGAALDAGSPDDGLRDRVASLLAGLLGDRALRMQMSGSASELIDGRGALRVFVATSGRISTAQGADVTLRLVEMDDGDWLLALQREPETRRHARNPAVPDVAEHRDWMKGMLASRDSLLAIVEAGGERAGMVRLDRRDDLQGVRRYEVSIAVAPSMHRRGVGLAALSLLRRLQPCAVFDATVKPENLASVALFESARFSKVGDTLYRSAQR